MLNHTAVCRIALICAVLGCSSESPVSLAPNAVGTSADLASSLAGVYEISFYDTKLQPVTTLPVCSPPTCYELVIGAHVQSITGAPAQGGSVTFQYCSYKGFPPNDITRADEAPSSACADGSASWKNLVIVPVNSAGNAYMDFGTVRIARTVGFRFKFAGQKSGVPNGTSQPADFTWF